MVTIHQKDSLPGKVLGKQQYGVKELLGSGSVCDVYLATQNSLFRRQVAVRVLKKNICSSSETEAMVHRKHFVLEVELMTRLKSPCFAQVYDSGAYMDDNVDRPYVVMEYIEGPTAWKWARETDVDVRSALLATLQVGEGLEELGKHSLAFRDLNPANVKWETVPNIEPRARLFDVTHVLPFKEASAGVAENLLVGVPPFAPLEQARGECCAAGDVWSLAAFCYFLLEGKPHLELPQPTWDAMRDVLLQRPELAFQKVSEADARVVGPVLQSALVSRPKDRATLPQFLEGLGEALLQLKCGNKRGSWRSVLGKFLK